MNKKTAEPNQKTAAPTAEAEAGAGSVGKNTGDRPGDRPNDAAAGEPTGGGSLEMVEAKTITLPCAEFEELKSKAARTEEHWDRLIRQAADFENYKKRAARERQEAARIATEALMAKLIPVIDNFEMALAAATNAEPGSVESLRAGIALIYNQLKRVLTDAGLEELDAMNQAFDPNWQEALSEQETSEAPEGQVVQQLRKGYRLRDRLIRPAAVVVARKPAA